MKKSGLLIFICVGITGLLFKAYTFTVAQPQGVTPEVALQRLLEGNARYKKGSLEVPEREEPTRAQMARSQAPFAIILGCADSRVSPTVIFDQGLGDLFVIRVAGNVLDDVVIGSVEYAVEHLGSRLVVVLGHENCGAVAATLEAVIKEGDIESTDHIDAIMHKIEPAVRSAQARGGNQEAIIDMAVRQNVKNVVAQLRTTRPLLAKAVQSGQIQVVGMRYDLHSGVTEVIER